MSQISWQYMAGFFDGEGCICWVGRAATPRVFITQTGKRGEQVFLAINKFLHSIGVVASIRMKCRAGQGMAKKDCYTLAVCNRIDAEIVLRGMFPYLWIKKTEAQDALRVFKMYPTGKNSWVQKTLNSEHLSSRYKLWDTEKRIQWRNRISASHLKNWALKNAKEI